MRTWIRSIAVLVAVTVAPRLSAQTIPPAAGASAQAAAAAKAVSPKASLLDINSASASALANLPGIGKDLAGKIVGGRPYSSTLQLVQKKILNQATFDRIKGLITAK